MENREDVTHAYLSVSCVGQLKLTVRRIVHVVNDVICFTIPFKLCDVDVFTCW